MATGRNEACPCGSGSKYKRCCLGKAGQASGTLDTAAIVDRAIVTKDWSVAEAVFDQGFALFHPGQPLEHVRFPRGAWTADWQRRCEDELTTLLESDVALTQAADGVRMVLHVLRRFGAKSRLTDSLRALEAVERDVRGRTLAELPASEATEPIRAWIDREQPAVLPFADWLALRELPLDQTWSVRTCARVQDLALGRGWSALAAAMQADGAAELCVEIMRRTLPRMTSPDEQLVHAIVTRIALDDDARDAVRRIMASTRDTSAAAMLRAVLR